MSISHRTNRLKLKGTPSVEKLQNGRYKLTVECTTMNSREDWYSANKARIFPDFGSLESAQMSIDGLAPRTGEAYTDMRLTEVQSGNRPSRTGEDYVVVLTYETLGSSFVQVKDDTFSYTESGLRKVTRKSIAESGTDYQKTIGESSISSQIDDETAVVCKLGSYEVNDTDSYREVTEVYMEAGTLSETEDKVGSQLSIVKETFSSTPSTPSGYSIASEQESNVDGISTKRFTFLKNNVQLSQSEDEVGSQNSITEEWFEPSASRKTKTNYSLARKEESNVEGIPTERYTFLKDNVVLSVSEDRVGSQLAITNEVFKPSNDAFSGKNVSGVALSGYSEASREKSNFEGIPTLRYRFLKNNVVLSETEDKVGSQLSIVKEVFNGVPDIPAGYSTANEQESNVDGIPTRRFTFLKNDVTLSKSENFVEGREQQIIEQFNGTPDAPTGGFSLADEQISDVDGIPTRRFTYLKNDVLMNETQSLVGSQLAIVREVFNGIPDTPSGYSIASKEISDTEGLPTERYTFLKNNVVLSESEDKVGSQLAIVKEVFNGTPTTPSGYSLANEQESDVDGIPTKRYTFLKDNVELSRSEDKVSSQLAITTQVFNPTSDPTEGGYSVARTEVSDVDGIPTKRFTFLKDNVELSRSEDKVGSQLAIITEVFNPTDDPTETGYSVARTEVSDVDGIPTERFTFLKDNVELSRSEDKVGSQLAITTEVFNGTPDTPSGYSIASEQESNVDGIPTRRFTFLKPSVLSLRISERNGGATTTGKLRIEVVEAFNEIPTSTISGVKIGDEVSNVEGIPTRRFTFAKGEGEIKTSTRPGRIDGTTEVTAVSYGTEVVPTGVLISKSETQQDGYVQFTNTCIQGTIEGTKTTYKDVVQVEVPGEVSCATISVSSGGESGTIAVPKVTPRRRKTIAAQVTIEVQSNPPNTASVAFDLGAVSCSVTSTNVSLTRGAGNTVSVVSGSNTLTATGFSQNFGASARIQTYPGCFLTSSSSSGSISYIASKTPRASGNVIVFDESNSSRDTICEGTGSTAAEGYSTTGIIKRNSRPIITALDGTTYYEVITWSV